MSTRLLLDTCTLIWTGEGIQSRLSKSAKREIEHPGRDICICAISVAEIAVLILKKRISLSIHWKQWIRTAVSKNGWSVIPVTWEIIEEAYCLPGEFHADPADRIIAATARIHDMSIVTPDDRLRSYPHVETVW